MSGKILGEEEGLGCQKTSWKKLKVFEIEVGKIAFSKSFGVSLLAHTEEPAVLEAVPASLQENLNSN